MQVTAGTGARIPDGAVAPYMSAATTPGAGAKHLVTTLASAVSSVITGIGSPSLWPGSADRTLPAPPLCWCGHGGRQQPPPKRHSSLVTTGAGALNVVVATSALHLTSSLSRRSRCLFCGRARCQTGDSRAKVRDAGASNNGRRVVFETNNKFTTNLSEPLSQNGYGRVCVCVWFVCGLCGLCCVVVACGCCVVVCGLCVCVLWCGFSQGRSDGHPPVAMPLTEPSLSPPLCGVRSHRVSFCIDKTTT